MIIYQDLFQSTFYVDKEFVELFQFNLILSIQQSVGIVFIYQLPASLEGSKLYWCPLLSILMRSLDTCCQVLPGTGLRELPGLQTVLMAGKERCYCVLPSYLLPYLYLLSLTSVTCLVRRRRSGSQSPQGLLLYLQAGQTDGQSEGGLTEDEKTCGLARLGLDMASQNSSLQLQVEVET